MSVARNLQAVPHGEDPSFRLVPVPPLGRTRGIPECRLRMIAFAKAHRGHWVQYTPDPQCDPTKLGTLRTGAKRGNASGFEGGFWDVATRAGVLHVRYRGPRPT